MVKGGNYNMKLLLYCTKSKPNLNKLYGKNWFYFGEKLIDLDVRLNGKIVAQLFPALAMQAKNPAQLKRRNEFDWRKERQ